MTYFVKHPFYAGNLHFIKGQELTDEGFELAVGTGNQDNIQTQGLVPNTFLSLEELEAKKAEIEKLILERQVEAEKANTNDSSDIFEVTTRHPKTKK